MGIFVFQKKYANFSLAHHHTWHGDTHKVSWGWTPKGWLFITEYNFGINTHVKLATPFMISFLLLFEIYFESHGFMRP
jgi:hypothetical protein